MKKQYGYCFKVEDRKIKDHNAQWNGMDKDGGLDKGRRFAEVICGMKANSFER